jgi:hypothetical protein
MKVSKYSASGTTQSSGMGATLALRFAETVTSNPDAHADSSNHSAICVNVGACAAGCGGAASLVTACTGCSAGCRLSKAMPMDKAANTTNAPLHPSASAREVKAGSSNNGKLNNASSEPAFDNANIQYGGSLPVHRMYQTCSNGLVELSISEGNPTVAVSSSRICQVGSPVPSGRHASDGRIGISRQLAISSPA